MRRRLMCPSTDAEVYPLFRKEMRRREGYTHVPDQWALAVPSPCRTARTLSLSKNEKT
jgi:hypothetical protein